MFDFWIARGVTVFRVDNPHTKAFGFWEWVIGAIRDEHPEVLFLSEDFTRPKRMLRLAKDGFTRSYTYFAWRNGPEDLRAYMEELTDALFAEPMRPLGEHRLKRSCLADVAGMCRSLDYARNAGVRDLEERGMLASGADVRAYADYWSFCAQEAFLRGYLRVIEPPLVPSDPGAIRGRSGGDPGAIVALLDAWTLHKAIYELNNRPDWITIPLRGVLGILECPTPA